MSGGPDVPRPVVLVVEHEAGCPPALFGRWLEDAGCVLAVCRPYAGDPVPADLGGYDALVVLGGSMGARDDDLHPWLAPVRALVLVAVAARVPMLGICLGHQMVAAALGGDVAANRLGQQLGVLPVGWTAEAAGDALVGGLAGPHPAVHWNHDVVTTLPEGAVLLASAPRGEIQAVRYAPTVWGIQWHPEVDHLLVSAWAEEDRDEHMDLGISAAPLLADIQAARAGLDAAWAPLAARLAGLAGAGR